MNTYGDVVTVLRAPLIDGWGGQQVRNWADAAETIYPAAVQPKRVTEVVTGRELITDELDMHIGGFADIVETDRVRWSGHDYEVTGVEKHYMLGRLDHLEVTLMLFKEPTT